MKTLALASIAISLTQPAKHQDSMPAAIHSLMNPPPQLQQHHYVDRQKMYIVENKIIINAKAILDNIFDDVPLIGATHRGQIEKVKLLLENGADVNVQNQFGYTASMIAMREEQPAIAYLLLKYGADMYIQDNYGNSPYSLSLKSYSNYDQMIKDETREITQKINEELGLSGPIIFYRTFEQLEKQEQITVHEEMRAKLGSDFTTAKCLALL